MSRPRKSNFLGGGKARATSISVPQLRDKERVTPPDAPKCSCPSGGAAFWFEPRCFSVADPCGYVSSSRLVQTEKSNNHAANSYL